MANFEKAFRNIIARDIGYLKEPESLFYVSVCKEKGHKLILSSIGINYSRISTFYKESFWNPFYCDDLVQELAETILDICLDKGFLRTNELLQATLGLNDDDFVKRNILNKIFQQGNDVIIQKLRKG
jgi:lysozyme family protein